MWCWVGLGVQKEDVLGGEGVDFGGEFVEAVWAGGVLGGGVEGYYLCA